MRASRHNLYLKFDIGLPTRPLRRKIARQIHIKLVRISEAWYIIQFLVDLLLRQLPSMKLLGNTQF